MGCVSKVYIHVCLDFIQGIAGLRKRERMKEGENKRQNKAGEQEGIQKLETGTEGD